METDIAYMKMPNSIQSKPAAGSFTGDQAHHADQSSVNAASKVAQLEAWCDRLVNDPLGGQVGYGSTAGSQQSRLG
jgi:hypothetical protein